MNNQRSVGSILKSARIAKGLDFPLISQSLKIHPRFLSALEEGNYSAFSSPVHLKGFLKNYAAYLGLNVDEILAFFRREYQNDSGDISGNSLKPLGSTIAIITPERVVSSFVVFLIVVFFLYLFFQYRTFVNAPELYVTQPPKDFKTLGSTINVAGRTSPDGILKINGQQISLLEDGSFTTAITLLDGVNVLNFTSINKIGKETKVVRTVIFERPEAETRQASSSAVLDLATIIINTSPNAAWLEIESLGNEELLFKGLMMAGVSEEFTDPVGIKVRTGNAGSTKIILNGNEIGSLGLEGEVVEKEFRR